MISLDNESKRKSDQSVIVLVSYRMYLYVAWLCPEIALGCYPMCFVGIRSVRYFGVRMGENG